MSSAKQQGFTLLEMMLAITLFSLVCLVGYQLLQAVLRNSELTQQHATRLADIQRAFTLMESDISQARSRPVTALSLPASSDFNYFRSGEANSLTLIHDNWRNPAAFLPRSSLERVTWRFQQGKLERLSHHQPDSDQQTTPKLVVTLSNISAFQLRFWSQGRWHDSWNQGQTLPEGVDMTLETDDFGPLQRVFFLTVNHEKS
ncbi:MULTISPECIES: type II secretion system minor pseudopilin GspJ [Yersinia]|uniref:Type II secretion system protein J n=2 Tax=Yersinia TaxID=629 RepID=A0AAI8ZQV3_YERFR|nr:MULTISPECIES: type II secretion system minor pseudopilin GspJ [Yersinia]AVX39908.1 type II secretion system protein GspJ [Yersinia massiliensis]MDN0126147.1 type II secretion system minor pseudopilin GspJ [Yersinia massiliensis]QKJ10637.1 type II secretion system minor pseudopilin GspJ [Yersinia massiliensis]CFQ99353.1 putative general secretion pathway protein J [Yersinia frederiksenii]